MQNLEGLRRVSEKANVSFFLMHGTLLGWFFNEETLPWDEDADVSYLYKDHQRLIAFGRQTLSKRLVFYPMPRKKDHIEFRVFDRITGVYTDITSLRLTKNASVLRAKALSQPADRQPPLYAMKSSFLKLWGAHLYRPEHIEPIQPCKIFEFRMWCPKEPAQVLRQEYRAFRSLSFKRWTFQPTQRCWALRQ